MTKLESDCTSKKPYQSFNAAKRGITGLYRAKKSGSGRLHAYHCPHCRWWHVGHVAKRR
jgi:hypothetical protein